MTSFKSYGEIKVPTRAAPAPPVSSSSWKSSLFAHKDKNVNNKLCQPKKKPPPRPPPPKFTNNRANENKGSQLVNGLFRPPSRPNYESVSALPPSGCLIDWTSPPSSPTSTTRSSSDALSVNSFGSDSVAPSSGSASNVESGFEDDFELFGAPARSSDPWSPQPVQVASSKSTWVSFSPNPTKKLNMPTIIRAKPERPKPPKILQKKIEMNELAEVLSSAYISSKSQTNTAAIEYDSWDSDSPPMPTCPPPAPPPELFAHMLSSQLETSSYQQYSVKSSEKEEAIALFDYSGAAGDLSFFQGETMHILRRIDDNWFEAELKGRVGSVPANFVQVKGDDAMVTALYTFSPETWEDLALQPGLKVKLLGRVNTDWLYGEADGRRGQLPALYVDHIPSNLPVWKA